MNLEKLKKHFPWITLIVLVIFVGLLDNNFLRPENLLQLAGDISTLFIMALGITFVIYIGGIDLSAQSVANMTTVLATLLLPLMGGFAALALHRHRATGRTRRLSRWPAASSLRMAVIWPATAMATSPAATTKAKPR